MHKSATKCNKTIGKWCKNKHGASKIIDTFETYHLPLVASVEMAEAIAMKEGLTLAVNMGCNSIVAESHSLVKVQTCMGKEMWWTTPTAIYADYIDILATIGFVRFCHCPREANQVAH
jgi:hypothetical protein